MIQILFFQCLLVLIFPLLNYDVLIYTEIFIINIFFTFFVFMFYLSSKIKKTSFKIYHLKHYTYFLYTYILLIIIHFLISIEYSLFFRRIGTEPLVALINSVPRYIYIPFRFIEFIIPVFTFLLLFYKNNYKKFVILSFIFFIFSSSSWTSRTDIAFYILIYIFVIFKSSTKNILIWFIFICFLILLQSFIRHDFNYEKINNEFVSISDRFDSNILTKKLIDNGNFNLNGNFEFQVYKYYHTINPFNKDANIHRKLGLTNAKSYFLNDVINSKYLDINYNMLIDLFYVYGFLSIIPLFFYCLLIYILQNSNIKFVKICILPVALFCLLRVEYEMFGSLFIFLRNFLMFLPFLLIFYFNTYEQKNNLFK